ncbi:MAG: aa3-type cytochrome c oxidase subunit IV [Devosiaceae bacterium]|nr:aa3-type cytochrome c oxidase subunit IV [Devosiaceae bacterium MH13]
MSESTENTATPANDYNEHNSTFELFISLVKWGTGLTVIVLILMAIFLL